MNIKDIFQECEKHCGGSKTMPNNIEKSENLVIQGDNLDVLKKLSLIYSESVNLIYIDPPYNTGSSSFEYKDKFERQEYLNFMKQRLLLARNLLSDSGAIYIQADYHQIHYLKVLMDEIFGENNFQREIIWRIGWISGFKSIRNNWIRNHDTILYYSKNKNKLIFNKNYITDDYKETSKKDSKVKRYPIEDVWNASKYDILNSIAITSFSGESISKLLNKNEKIKGQKPEKLLKRIIEAHTSEGDLVLDFFGGSGTTAAVAHKMNRHYISCEISEHLFDIEIQRLNKVIDGEQSGISKLVNWTGGGSFVSCKL